jgi:hypothetical protein
LARNGPRAKEVEARLLWSTTAWADADTRGCLKAQIVAGIRLGDRLLENAQ